MAERTITIRIVSQQNSAPSPDAQSGESMDVSKPSARADSGEGSGNEGGGSPLKATIAAAAFYLTKETISTVRSYAMAGYGRYINLTEDYQAEQAMQNQQARLNMISSVASSTTSGAAFGLSVGGPIGAIIGGIVGLVVGGLKEKEKIQETLAEQERQLHTEAYSLYFNTVRAGQVNYSRGTEN